MRTLTSLTTLAFATLALTFAACGGDDSTGTIDAPGGTIDAPNGTIDAGVDAPTSGASLGMACTGDGQGTCPAGYACLNLQGGSGMFCSQTCTGTQDTSCGNGYTGPGFPACILKVDFMDGNPAVPHCGIVCEDEPGNPVICPGGAAQCNGTCPGTLQCNGGLMTMAGMLQGKACI
ncbi:MAG TPA: hypothetical protein VHE35_33325 [Kofleriaceae bacterium]|nr:hypothetical protein [Kofleriaceae bacterium]